MNGAYNNFGLDGQEEYDNLFCGKRCRKRRKKRRAIRLERRRLKNDAQLASNERMRAETKIMQQTMSAPKRSYTAQLPITGHQVTSPASIKPKTQQAGFGNNTIMVVGIGLLVAGYLWHQNKQGTTPPAHGVAPGFNTNPLK